MRQNHRNLEDKEWPRPDCTVKNYRQSSHPSSVSKISQQGSTQDLGGFPLHVEPFDLSLGNRMGRQMTAPAARDVWTGGFAVLLSNDDRRRARASGSQLTCECVEWYHTLLNVLFLLFSSLSSVAPCGVVFHVRPALHPFCQPCPPPFPTLAPVNS